MVSGAASCLLLVVAFPSFPSHNMFGSWGAGVVLDVGSQVQSFYRQVVTSWGSLAYGAVVLGTCPPLAADIVKQS